MLLFGSRLCYCHPYHRFKEAMVGASMEIRRSTMSKGGKESSLLVTASNKFPIIKLFRQHRK